MGPHCKKNNRIHIVGTGTIGEPLISLFLRYKKEFDIDEITFHKNTPLKHDLPKIKQLIQLGAILTTDLDKIPGFRALGVEPAYTRDEAIDRADVIIDCTPAGLKGKPLYETYRGQEKIFLAQGSEFGFGKPYARGINEKALTKEDEFIHIVSCNTHNIAVLLHSLETLGKINGSRFVCIRRANDISQNSGMIPAVEVGKHSMGKYGTHHARDVYELFKTLGKEMPVYSSACKVPTQYMHTLQFSIKVECDVCKSCWNGEEEESWIDSVVDVFKMNTKICLTNHLTSNKVFSFGREYGHNGRILSQTVISTPSLQVRKAGHSDNVYEITGFCFTPQDSNSLLSSVAAALWHLHDNDWDKVNNLLDVVKPYLFQEV